MMNKKEKTQCVANCYALQMRAKDGRRLSDSKGTKDK